MAGRSTRSLGVMRALLAAGILCWSAAAAAVNYVDDLGRGPRYRLFFPPFKRVETETGSGRVTSIMVTVRCGYFTGVSRIPGDWWLEMHGPISRETTLVAQAGHGASYLYRLETWNGSIAVSPLVGTVIALVVSGNSRPA